MRRRSSLPTLPLMPTSSPASARQTLQVTTLWAVPEGLLELLPQAVRKAERTAEARPRTTILASSDRVMVVAARVAARDALCSPWRTWAWPSASMALILNVASSTARRRFTMSPGPTRLDACFMRISWVICYDNGITGVELASQAQGLFHRNLFAQQRAHRNCTIAQYRMASRPTKMIPKLP